MVSLALSLVLGQAVDGWTPAKAGDRARLEVPLSVWTRVLDNVGPKKVGYTYEQMRNFPAFPGLLRVVENSFRDVRGVSRFAGLFGDNLLAAKDDPAALTGLLFSQLDARAARDLPTPPRDGWGVPWLPDAVAPSRALPFLVRHSPDLYGHFRAEARWKAKTTRTEGLPAPVPPETAAAWARLPAPHQRLAVRLFVAAAEAWPFLSGAYEGLKDPRFAAKPYEIARALFADDTNDDTGMVPDALAASLPQAVNLNLLAAGTAVFNAQLREALREFAAAPKADLKGVTTFRFQTKLGAITIAGPEDDAIAGDELFVLDLGGNDTYRGRVATPKPLRQPISFIVDLGGNDRYVNPARGFLGLGEVVDLAGDDVYTGGEHSIGAGLYGAGVILDEAGDDRYIQDAPLGIGAANVGIGLLVDKGGDDVYLGKAQTMGYGGPYGVGVLLDVAGKDDYRTDDAANASVAWGGKTVSMAMGCGYGRRSDSGDGINLAGGIGALVDGAGDDRYHTSTFTLGSGYWWGFGIFEDRGGNDEYRSMHYAMGSGAHFALGSFADLSGDDRYNAESKDGMEHWGAIGRDGSIGVFMEGSGNDVYGMRRTNAAFADLNSVALFYEREGDDRYVVHPTQTEAGDDSWKPFASVKPYSPLRTFRDELPSVSLFLDTYGKDTYEFAGGDAGDGREWRRSKGPLNWAYGLDL